MLSLDRSTSARIIVKWRRLRIGRTSHPSTASLRRAIPRSSLGAKARISAAVDISFGLGISILAIASGYPFNFGYEVLMNNANAVMVCVWCGVAFLRGPGG